ncbi:MAG TPA: hypothetical protein PLB89_12410 [Flavobacteriales bacterium]|nr:hypothetical protein [Flavobacteriales bacterium]
MRTGIIAIWCTLVLMACKKEQADIMPMEPEIELISIGPSAVVEFEQPIILRFSYKDGNGDLGRIDPDDHSLWVKDSRLAVADGYHIIPLAPPDTEVPIQGELEVELDPLFLLGNGAEEIMTYSFHVVDNAGNKSNEITTPAIVITAQDSL